MKLLQEVNDEVEGVEHDEPEKEDIKDDPAGPAVPDGWSIGHLANHGMILSCDGFQLKLDIDQLNLLFDIAEDGEAGEIKDHNGKVIYVEPTDDSIVLSRTNDEVYPSGVVLDLDTLKEMGIEKDAEEEPEEDSTEPETEHEEAVVDDTIKEGVKPAYRRVGKKIKRGFRVTSGFRKGRVVSSAAGAFKPRAKASTRMKLKIAARKHKIVRVLKSKKTKKKSLSKRLARMNKR